MFLCDEVVQIIRVLVLTRRPNRNARNMDSWPYSIQILWQYILSHSKLCGSKHLYKPTHLSYGCTIFRGSMKGVDWQKD